MSGLVLNTLENAVKDWISAHLPTGWVATWADQNAPKATDKQVILKRGNLSKIGSDVYGKVDPSNGSRPILGTREIVMEMRGFGAGATQVLSDVSSVMEDDSADDSHVAAGFAVIGISEIRNLTSIYSSQYKEIAMMEIRIRAHSLRESTDAETGVGYIRSVDLEVTTKSPGTPDVVEHLVVVTPPG